MVTSSSARGNRTVPASASRACKSSHICSVDAVVFPLSLAYNVSEEMASLKQFPNFRFFMTGRSFAPSPEFDFPSNSSCDANSPSNCNRWLTAAEALQASAQKNFLETFSAVCFMTVRDIARLHINQRPVALIQSAWGGTRVEAWMSSEAIAAAGSYSKDVPSRAEQNNASVLYNAMVAPWDRFAVRAAIWYQV